MSAARAAIGRGGEAFRRGAVAVLRLALATMGLSLAARGATPGEWLRSQIATAPPGAVVRVPAGVYEGPFEIAQPLRLQAEPGAVLRGDGRGHVVAIRAPDVELAGFLVRGSGRNLSEDSAAIHVTGTRADLHDNRIVDMLHGIYVRKANDCRIVGNTIVGDGERAGPIADPLVAGIKAAPDAGGEMCAAESSQDRRGNGIHLWNSSGHFIAGNAIRGTRDGIYFSFTERTTVRDNRIERVRYGLHYMYSDDNVFERNVFSDNAAGAALMYSERLVLRGNRFVANRSHRAYGLLLQSVDDTRIEDNAIEGNTIGCYLQNSNRNLVRRNRVVGNYIGLRISDSSADSTFTENTFAGNIHSVETSGANTANTWAAAGRGNRWEGALQLDLDRDGVADVPHREPDLFGAWRRAFPSIGLLSASPGERLLRFIHSRLALPGLPGIADPKPLTTSHPPTHDSHPRSP